MYVYAHEENIDFELCIPKDSSRRIDSSLFTQYLL